MSEKTVIAVCSAKPRPSVQSSRHKSGFYKTGHCLWGRDIYHAQEKMGKTLCGVNSSDFLHIGGISIEKMKADDNFYTRCLKRLP